MKDMAEITAFIIGMIIGGAGGLIVAAVAITVGKDEHQCW